MKFEEAFNIYFDRMKQQNPNFVGFTEETARSMASAWNMVAIAENTLDDLAIINSNNSIISLPLKRDDVNEKEAKATKRPKGAKPNDGTGSATE